MRLTRIGLGSFIICVFLAAMTLGIRFSITLVQYGYYILIASLFLMISYVQNEALNWHDDEQNSVSNLVVGIAGATLLALFFGIQSPQIPVKYTMGLGAVFLVITIYEQWRDKGR